MKIGLVVPGFSTDERDWCIPALRNLVGRLAATDEVHVLALRYPYQSGAYRVGGARVTALGGAERRGWRAVALWRQALTWLAAEHRRHGFDVLHAFWATETGAVTAIAGRILGIPTIVSLAGGELVGFRDIGYGGQLATMERLKIGLALRYAHIVTAGSRSLLALAARHPRARPVARLQRVPLGVDLELFQPASSPASVAPPTLIHVASLAPVKDQATLLHAVANLQRRGVPFRLEMAGTGLLAPVLHQLATRLEIAPVVRFHGAVPHHLLPALYRGGVLFVLSSRHEAQGMAVLEAAASGLPVVGTRVGVLPELTDAATAVSTSDPRALADALAAALRDPEQRQAMGRAGRARVEAEFGLARSAARFRQLYASLA